MALSDDQKALLRLLAQREQGYEDIAALKGRSVAEVRDEVRTALEELDAPRPEPAPPPSPPPAPDAGPETAAPAAAKPAATVTPASSQARPAGVPLERRRFLLFAAGGLAAIAIVVGLIALIGGDGGSDSGTTASVTEGEIATGESDKVTQATLSAVDGGDASGQAIFGRVGKEEVVLQVTAENLEPTGDGESYTVWLYRSPKLSLRVGSVAVGSEGNLGARFTIPAELLAYVASGAFDQIYVSKTSNAAYRQEVARAKANKTLPRYTGETVLTGPITGPIAKAQAEGG